jgi:teichuronic acid biosynthesis glycosyltransferase TuaC
LKVLFISREKQRNPSVIVLNQAKSLESLNIKVEHLLIKRGFFNYLNSIRKIQHSCKSIRYDVVHAHYGFCGLIALLSNSKIPLVVSFMGSDLHGGKISSLKTLLFYIINRINSLIVQIGADRIIVKSLNLYNMLLVKNKASVIPNGVCLGIFYPYNKDKAKLELDLNGETKYILFLGEPMDNNKNVELINSYCEKNSISVLTPYPVSHSMVRNYLNASELLVLCSFKEGSPNVIKEALACNRPIVSTPVGDVERIMGNEPGCFISTFKKKDFHSALDQGLSFSNTYGNTSGRKRLIKLGLDSLSTAKKINQVYTLLM